MEDRHLHFGIVQALWFLVAFVVLINFAKFMTSRFYIPGVTELVHNA